MAANFLVAAAFMVFVMALIPFGVASVLQWRENRTTSRIKRGLCPACAYPVGDSEGCTECGKPLRANALNLCHHEAPNRVAKAPDLNARS